MTRCFYAATEFGQDQEFSCSEKIFLCHDRDGQGEENLLRDREFNVATELPEIVSRLGIPYVATESSKT